MRMKRSIYFFIIALLAINLSMITCYAKTNVQSAEQQLTIIEQPESQIVPVGTIVELKILADGVESYQWQSKLPGGAWTDLSWSGNNTNVLSFKATEYRMTYSYRCVLIGKNGEKAYSNVVNIRQLKENKLTIIKQPETQKVPLGSMVSLSIKAEGASAYQWQYSQDGKNWTDLSWPGSNIQYERVSPR